MRYTVQSTSAPANNVEPTIPLSPKKLRARPAAAKPPVEKPRATEKPRVAEKQRVVEKPQAATTGKQAAGSAKASKQAAKPVSTGRPGRPPSAATAVANTTSSTRNTAASGAASNVADNGKKVRDCYAQYMLVYRCEVLSAVHYVSLSVSWHDIRISKVTVVRDFVT